MNNQEPLPDRIYLQFDEEGPSVDEATWCQDRINEADIEYVRADLHAARQQVAAPAVPVGYANPRHLSLLQEGKWLIVSMSSDPQEVSPGSVPLYTTPPLAELRRRVQELLDSTDADQGNSLAAGALVGYHNVLAILDELEQA